MELKELSDRIKKDIDKVNNLNKIETDEDIQKELNSRDYAHLQNKKYTSQ